MAILKSLSLLEKILLILFFIYLVGYDWMNNGFIAIFAGVYAFVAMVALVVKGIYLTRKKAKTDHHTS